MKPPQQITASARPLRVAFVIENGDNVHRFLDAVFNESFGRDGGRQSLVVPVIDGDIPQSYLCWLKAYDPDIAFIATSANEKLAKLIDQSSTPILIHPITRYPSQGSDDFRAFRTRNQSLTSLSWLPFLKVTSGEIRARPELILDCYPTWQDDGLITDNFGTLQNSFDRFPLHRELDNLVRPLVLTPKDAQQDRCSFGIQAEEITDAYGWLSNLGRSGHAISLAYLSNIASKQMVDNSHDWTNSFCLVVGDSFEDRVSCWNAGLLFDNAHSQPYKTLRLPSTVISDATKIEQVKKFLNDNNWINPHGSQPQITVRSASLSKEQMDAFVKQVGSNGSWGIYRAQRIQSIEDCCPPHPPGHQMIGTRSLNQDVQIPFRHKNESAPVPKPLQLTHASFAHPICSTGQWIAQYRIDRNEDHNQFANLRDIWLIPKRNFMTRLFVGKIEARITSDGILAIPVDNSVGQIDITEPSDHDFFYSLLHGVDSHPYPDIRFLWNCKTPYEHSRPSDKGRYLQGVLGMFGSLDRAYDVLTNSFWRQQFTKLGSPSENQYPQLIQTLKKKFPPQAGKYTFERDDQWEKLARTMVRQAVNMRQPRRSVKLRTLIEEWSGYLKHAIEMDEHLQKQKDNILAESYQELVGSLERLCLDGVFHQGYSWSCSHCAYRNWAALNELKSVLECQVCRQEHRVPIDIKFDFRLNEFFSTCIREHDTLSVIWALGKLQREMRPASFIFAPQTDLFRISPHDKHAEADCEIDLLCVIDGKILIGEVKASLAEIDRIQLDKLIQLARDLHPDIILIGALDGDAKNLDTKVGDVQKKVGAHIEVRGVLANEEMSQIAHYLP